MRMGCAPVIYVFLYSSNMFLFSDNSRPALALFFRKYHCNRHIEASTLGVKQSQMEEQGHSIFLTFGRK